jgi:hypothetical protein
MAKSASRIPEKLKPWIEARERHRLSDAHVQMARELGLNPKKLGGQDNHRQEPWKAPLPDIIAHLYFKSFGKERPDVVRSLGATVAAQVAKKATRKAARAANPRPPEPAAPPAREDFPSVDGIIF